MPTLLQRTCRRANYPHGPSFINKNSVAQFYSGVVKWLEWAL